MNEPVYKTFGSVDEKGYLISVMTIQVTPEMDLPGAPDWVEIPYDPFDKDHVQEYYHPFDQWVTDYPDVTDLSEIGPTAYFSVAFHVERQRFEKIVKIET
jgi:hypothetical protein